MSDAHNESRIDVPAGFAPCVFIQLCLTRALAQLLVRDSAAQELQALCGCADRKEIDTARANKFSEVVPKA